ncbi:hypothetical protein RRG08_042383 [Elysia crispata]|uniref:Uncharacterized protein n=1 Tax=Elysia crispata TaxID=231223 RepID=A0AAE1DEL5_9GAST|nr:hypothetical protein RRG08_042383 [Elysia crispata]
MIPNQPHTESVIIEITTAGSFVSPWTALRNSKHYKTMVPVQKQQQPLISQPSLSHNQATLPLIDEIVHYLFSSSSWSMDIESLRNKQASTKRFVMWEDTVTKASLKSERPAKASSNQ